MFRAVKEYGEDTILWENLAQQHLKKSEIFQKKAQLGKINEGSEWRNTMPMKRKQLMKEKVKIFEEEKVSEFVEKEGTKNKHKLDFGNSKSKYLYQTLSNFVLIFLVLSVAFLFWKVSSLQSLLTQKSL